MKHPSEPALLLRMATTAFVGLCGWFYQYLREGPKESRIEDYRLGKFVLEGAGANLEDRAALGTAVTMTTDELNMCMDAIEQYRGVLPGGVNLAVLEQELRAVYNWESCRKPSRFLTQETQQKTGPCFVATAVYGSPMAHEVQTLRTYRDTVMRCSRFGRGLVRLYGRVGPNVAQFIANKPFAKEIIRWAVLRPVISLVRRRLGS